MTNKGLAKNIWVLLVVIIVAIAALSTYYYYSTLPTPSLTVLRIALGIDPERSEDPQQSGDSISQSVSEHIFQTLMGFDFSTGAAEVVSRLAISWEQYNETFYELKLRQDVKFSDGHDFTADDVLYTWDRFLHPEEYGLPVAFKAGFYKPFERIEKVDDYTIRLGGEFPTGVTLANLNHVCTAILPSTGKLVGTGPYKWVEHIEGERLVLERNELYWGDKPYFDELVYIPISDTASRMIALETGTVDVAIDVPPYEIERLEGTGIKIESALTTRHMFFYYNLVTGPCTDVRVRRALNYAVDREEICETLFGGMARPCNGVLNALVFGTDDAWREDFFDYNPDKAKELLTEAGYAEGEITLKLVGPDGRYMFDRDTVTLIAGYFNEIGVETEVEVTEWGSYWNAFIEGARAVFNGEQETFDWDLAYIGISADNLDADHDMQTLFSTGQICCNMNNFSDPRMDEYRIEGLQELDPDKRLAIYKEATDLVLELAPHLWLFHMPYVFGMQPNIAGCEGDPIGKYHFWGAYETS